MASAVALLHPLPVLIAEASACVWQEGRQFDVLVPWIEVTVQQELAWALAVAAPEPEALAWAWA